eukprot:4854987-Prymnesium_polylepis.1
MLVAPSRLPPCPEATRPRRPRRADRDPRSKIHAAASATLSTIQGHRTKLSFPITKAGRTSKRGKRALTAASIASVQYAEPGGGKPSRVRSATLHSSMRLESPQYMPAADEQRSLGPGCARRAPPSTLTIKSHVNGGKYPRVSGLASTRLMTRRGGAHRASGVPRCHVSWR